MSNLIVSDFLKQALKFLPVDFTVEGKDFELMPLTDELIEKAKELSTSDKLVDFAADNAISSDGERLTDNEKALCIIKRLWAHEDMPETNPTIKYQVGEKTLEISGLDDLLLDLLADEKEAAERLKQDVVVNEDFIAANGETDLHQIHQDNVAAG